MQYILVYGFSNEFKIKFWRRLIYITTFESFEDFLTLLFL